MALRDEVLEHLWRRFPQHCAILTDPRTLRAIDVGIERAAHHGFHSEADVRSFVVLMIFLGSHFDEDPQLPWVAAHLGTINDLLTETTQRMEPIVGRRGEHYRSALRLAEAYTFERIAADYDDSDDGLRAMLTLLHVRKYDALGPGAVARLIDIGRSTAARHGLTTPAGVIVYVALMFLLGSAIDRDPFHPWVNETLATGADRDPETLARALHARAIAILRRFTRLDQLMQGAW